MDPITYIFRSLSIDNLFFSESSDKKSRKRFCPNCGSHKVAPDDRHTNNLGEMIFNLDQWLCKECGYAGLMPVEDEEGREEIEFEPKEQETVDTAAGKGLFNYYIKIMIPAMILAYLLFRYIL